MKKLSALILLSWAAALPVQAGHSLQPLWQTADLATPESVLFVANKVAANKNEADNTVVNSTAPFLLVALIDGQGADVDGKGGIAKLAADGRVIDKNWIVGLNAPKGMALYNNRLYVADITELVVIDLAAQKVINKIPIAESIFLNDVTVNARGEVFVSDTRANKIHRIVDDKAELYLDKVASANGLKALGSQLIVGAGPELLQVDADKKITLLAKGFAQGIDGIEMTGPNEFIVSCWAGLVYYVYADGRIELLIDSQVDKINTADIGYDPVTRQLFVPNFFKNSVTAYQVK